MKNCPICNSDRNVREVIYGMPSDAPDLTKYAIGGCCISEEMPEFKCLKCEWEDISNFERGTSRQ